MRWLILIMLRLVLVHVPGGDELELNPHEVSSIREPKDVQEHFQRDVHCIIVMTNGKFIGAVEDCRTVKMMIEMATEDKR
jgi:hypothetical protein